jgi:AbrB family looped-hinge helix DNA binding protein
MPTKSVGPKGQIVIPKRMREAIGIKPGVEVVLELRDDEIVICKGKVEGTYTDYFVSTQAPKLKKPINIKQMIEEEVSKRHALP